MIGSLRGVLLHRSASGEVTIEVGGLGYRVITSADSSTAVGGLGDEIFVWVHHHQREDGSTMYGFTSLGERDAFEALLGARGVGPALALAILSVHRPDELAAVVAARDIDALCLVPGVGKKSAVRLLVELERCFDVAVDAVLEDPAGDRPASAMADVRAALGELGYGPDEVRDALRDLHQVDDASALLRDALARLSVSA